MDFTKAVQFVQRTERSRSINNSRALQFYGLYKQATLGSTSTPRPRKIQVRKYRKWCAWKGYDGMDQQVAKDQYVELLTTTVPDWM